MQLNSQYSALPQMNTESVKRDKTLDKIIAAQQLNMEDSASRSIASMLQSDISGALQGVSNANDGISMMQIADSTLTNLSQQTQTLNDFSVRYNSAAMNESQKQMLQEGFDRTVSAMQQSIDNTSFNGQSLFNSSFNFSLGEGTLNASLDDVSPQTLSIDDQSSIQAYSQNISQAQSNIGSTVNGFISSVSALMEKITASSAAKSQIADTDMAKAISEFQRSNNQLSAAQIAMAHQTDTLRQSIGRLLG